MRQIDRFTEAYLEAAIFTDEPDIGSPDHDRWGDASWSPEAIEQARKECAAFQAENAADIDNHGESEQAGHDFWLTRNHHGAGFWDGDWPDEVGQRLTDASHRAGERDVYVGDDGDLYFSPGTV